jgi:NADH-quinone oxidoreductase subunit D
MVIDAEPDIGFLHSGFEKLGEVLDFNQYVTIVDRMNYISPMANEIAWHHAVEKLLGIELTPRCKYIRTIFAELMRIHDHLLCLGTCVLDLGGATAFMYAFNERETIYEICERASGQRFHTSYTRVGGLLYDVTDDWVTMVRDFARNFPKVYRDFSGLVMKNRIFVERTRDVGVLSREEAIAGGATGNGGDQVFVENNQVVTASYQIPVGRNASTVSPITINSDVVVTVPSGSRWVVL